MSDQRITVRRIAGACGAEVTGIDLARPLDAETVAAMSWAPDALTMWDNRAAQHFAINDHDGFRRELHRTSTMGERPLSVAEARQARAAA